MKSTSVSFGSVSVEAVGRSLGVPRHRATNPTKVTRPATTSTTIDRTDTRANSSSLADSEGMEGKLEILERGRLLAFSFDDLMLYHGPGSPGGVAHAFKVLERALPLLEPAGRCERREIVIETAFGGPGARDAIEMATRAATDGRFQVTSALERPELGRTRERFVFHVAYRNRETTLVLREGFVTDEFLDLARTEERTADQEQRLDRLKLDMAERVIARPPAEVYDAE